MLFKAMLKKQLLETEMMFFQNRKTGKQFDLRGRILYGILYIFVFACACFGFGAMGYGMGVALHELGKDYLYFSMMGLLAIALGVIGSVFNTYAGLYHAKDNDLLLSMPIPPAVILAVRMIGVYAMALLFTALVWLPGMAAYWIFIDCSAAIVIFDVLLLFILALFNTVLTCALGWVVAKISGKLKNKSIITVLISVVLIAAYYVGYSKLMTLFEDVSLWSSGLDGAVTSWLYPIYMLSLGALGEVGGFMIFTLITAALLTLCMFIMARSFRSIVASDKGGAKIKYISRKAEARSPFRALVSRELQHFVSSPTYMLNCGLGLLFLPALGIFAVVKQADLSLIMQALNEMFPDYAPRFIGVLAGVLALMIDMNMFTTPSISLEGKNLWLVQSLPVSSKSVLMAKLAMHMQLNVLPVLAGAVLIGIAFGAGVAEIVLLVIVSELFALFNGLMGLVINLKKPVLNWTNEASVVKQGSAVVIVLFGGWTLCLAMIAGAVFLPVSSAVYLLLLTVVLLGACFLLNNWLTKRGTKIFEAL